MKKFLLALSAAFAAIAANAADYYLAGGFNNWTANDPTCKFTAKSETLYELTMAKELTSDFKVTQGDWNKTTFGSNGSKLEKGKAYSYSDATNCGDIQMDGALANAKVVLDLSAKTLTITGDDAEIRIGYQLWGNFDGSTTWAGPGMEKVSDDEWQAYVLCTKAGEFGIKENTNGVQTNWFAATAAGVIVGGESTGIDITTTSPQNFKVMPNTAGYTIILHPVSMKMDVKVGKSGIASIEADSDVAPVYYNLQGVRVENAQNGLFIEVRGNKAVKVVK